MIKKDGTESKKMGRPLVDIRKDQFENLCNMQCTLVEIAGFFHCCEDTIENWCKKTYNRTFLDTYKEYSQNGKISLRRTQFKLAEKSSAMAIFLGKQYLGQTEKIETTSTVEDVTNLQREIDKELNAYKTTKGSNKVTDK